MISFLCAVIFLFASFVPHPALAQTHETHVSATQAGNLATATESAYALTKTLRIPANTSFFNRMEALEGRFTRLVDKIEHNLTGDKFNRNEGITATQSVRDQITTLTLIRTQLKDDYEKVLQNEDANVVAAFSTDMAIYRDLAKIIKTALLQMVSSAFDQPVGSVSATIEVPLP